MFFQLAVALYGGYFGAGIGILMLAALSLMGHTDIHQMNGLKNLLATCINVVAAVYFAFADLVFWPDACVLAVGAIDRRHRRRPHRPPDRPHRRPAHRHRRRIRDGAVADVQALNRRNHCAQNG